MIPAKKKILITGGAGYIGSHTAQKFLDCGYEVIIYDNLSTGFMAAVPNRARFVHGDILDREKLSKLFQIYKFDCVVHFAAKLIVEESVHQPFLYYENNVAGTLSLLEICKEFHVNRIVFSSTAAVYGNSSGSHFVSENSMVAPLNPYGKSKLIVEGLLEDAQKAYGLNYVVLRYFNVAGAALDGSNGQRTKNATHLVKVAAEVALGKRSFLKVFGSDYETADGTCVRDYIHVEDLADIHLLAAEYLMHGRESVILNCGYGVGFSVLDVIKSMREVSQTDFKLQIAERRMGDAAQLVADAKKIKTLLNWTPRRDNLKLICETAFKWEKSNLEAEKNQIQNNKNDIYFFEKNELSTYLSTSF